LNNWNAFRVIRLALGIMIAVQAYQATEYAMILIGAAFSLLALFDLGCSSGACAPANSFRRNINVQQTQSKKEIEYEEVGN
jgi:hypothetical protein